MKKPDLDKIWLDAIDELILHETDDRTERELALWLALILFIIFVNKVR